MNTQSKITVAHDIPVIEYLPLSDLTLSNLNPRQEVSEEGIALLADSLVTCGLIQNLAGIMDAKGKVAIVAGGRRLRALAIAVKSRPDLGIVPVQIAENATIALQWANAENTARIDLDAVDEIRAYGKMMVQDRDVGKIAQAFGVTEAHVRRRLALANLPAPVLDALKSGEISMGLAQAFTVGSDEKLILEVLEDAIKGYMNEYTVKNRLNPQSIDGDSREATFVGLESYEAEGGTVTRDLFEDEVLLNNPDIIERLFAEKLAEQTAALKDAEGWAWVTFSEESSLYWYELQEQNGFARVYKIEGTLDEKQAARFDELTELSDSDALDEKGCAELAALKAITEGDYSAAQKAIAGAIVNVDHNGVLQSVRGLIDADDQEEAVVAGILEESRHSLSQQATAPKAAFSQKFIEDMRSIRLAAVQTALLDKPEFVLDLLAFCLSPASGYYNDTLALQFNHEKNAPSIDDAFALHGRLGGERSDKEEATRDKLREQAHGKTGEAFKSFRAMGKKTRNAQITESFARAFKMQAPEFMAEVESEAGSDVRSIWTPNAGNCFKRMKGHQLETLFMFLLDLKPSSSAYKGFSKSKKGEKDAILEALFNVPTAQKVRGVTAEQKARIDSWVPDCM
jgi:ParB family transcriptional regulator, chromosome partitioning protein